jgi:hypothetical protein
VFQRLRNWWIFRHGPIELNPEEMMAVIGDAAEDLGFLDLAADCRKSPPVLTAHEAILRLERLKHPGVPDDQLIQRLDE